MRCYVRSPHKLWLVRKTPASWTQTLPVARGAHLLPGFELGRGGCTVQRTFFCWLKKRSSNFSRPPGNTWPPRKGGNLKPASWNDKNRVGRYSRKVERYSAANREPRIVPQAYIRTTKKACLYLHRRATGLASEWPLAADNNWKGFPAPGMAALTMFVSARQRPAMRILLFPSLYGI